MPSQTLTIGKGKTETDIRTHAHAHTYLSFESEQAKVVHRTMELVNRQKQVRVCALGNSRVYVRVLCG